MKLAFSTVGCPDFQWSEIYSMAKDLGFDGIEVRGLGKEISTFNMQPFSEGEIDRTVRTLADLRLSIPCLSSGIALKFADKRAANIAELTDYIHMAARLGAPYVRVMGDWDAAPGGEVDDEPLLRKEGGYRRIAEYFNKERPDGFIIPINKHPWSCNRPLSRSIPPPEEWDDESGVIEIPDDIIWARRGQATNDFGAYYYGSYILPKKSALLF